MSQSDYITYKRTQNIWNNGKLPPIFDPSTYTSLVDYSLENTVLNTKLSYSQLIPLNTQNIFSMEKSRSLYCVSFPVCSETNERTNRKLNIGPIASIQPGKYKKVQAKYCCHCKTGRNCYCNKKICKSSTRQICKNCHEEQE